MIQVEFGFGSAVREAGGTPMPQTPVEFVDGIRGLIVSVHQTPRETHFPSIVGMMDEIASDAWNDRVGVSGYHHLVPFQGFRRGEA